MVYLLTLGPQTGYRWIVRFRIVLIAGDPRPGIRLGVECPEPKQGCR